jgi:superfamily I DNA and/or RNA helicase
MQNLEYISRALKKYKELLCNFTRKNKELYFREGNTAVPLSKLVLSNEIENKEKYKSEFEPLRLNSQAMQKMFNDSKLSLNDFFRLGKFENRSLEKKIDKIRQEDSKYQKEFGLSGAWFLGPFLVWKSREQGPDEVIISPILKIPIDIEKGRGNRFELRLESDELLINPTLKLYLKNEYNVDIPDRFESNSLPTFLEILKDIFKSQEIEIHINSNSEELVRIPPKTKNIKDADGQTIAKEKTDINKFLKAEELEIYGSVSTKSFIIQDLFFLDHINATKMALYNDYEKIMNSFDHELIAELLSGSKIPVKVDKSKISEINKYKEKDNFFVVDIDSSQHLAIDQAKSQRAIVIQGPPGTGKSQTITNLISQLMAENKKVLFVAEKRAALDVVYQRLKSSDLDKQTIIIHSSDLERKEFYKSFIDTLSEEHFVTVDKDWEKASEQVDYLKNKILDYTNAIKGIDEISGLTIVDLLTYYSEVSKVSFNLKISDYFSSLSHEKVLSLQHRISDLKLLIDQVPNCAHNLWFNKKTGYILTDKTQQELQHDIQSSISILEKITSSNDNGRQLFSSVVRVTPLADLPSLNIVGQQICLQLINKLRGAVEELNLLISETRPKLNDLRTKYVYYDMFSEDSDLGLMKELSSYFAIPRGFFDWFSIKFWRMKSTLKFFLKDKSIKLQQNKEIRNWIEFKELAADSVNKLEKQGGIKIDSLSWDIESLNRLEKNLMDATDLINKLSEVGRERLGINLDVKGFEKLISDYNKVSVLGSERERLEIELRSIMRRLSDCSGFVFIDNLENLNELKQEFSRISADAVFINNIEKINNLFSEIQQEFPLSEFKKFFVSNLIDKPDVIEILMAQAIKGWHEKLIRKVPQIQRFDSKVHNELINQFKIAIDVHRRTAKKAVNNNLAKIKGSTQSIDPNSLKTLTHESNKQRRIKPPREVMESGALNAMTSIKRCWLMSPLSISQVMPNIKGLFDVVIFDEASQVRVEDAIPSIYRGKNLIVVGDNKQMPPTNFFSGGSGDDDYDDEDDIELGESLLDQSLKAYPDILLEWHYRSKSEVLIAFSNFAFYGGKLIAPPNPSTLVKGKPIEFVNVEGGYFNSKEGNSIEAGQIVKEIVEILTKDHKASIGIISMGMSQQKIIEKLLDEEAERNKDFAEKYELALNYEEDGAFVGFFNKNLENVQGDERDYIIISVGYAPQKPGANLRKAFGPLSTSGGGRRLNVAITRAKKKVKVFCSFDPSQLDMSEEAFKDKPDATCFARYLNYAKAVSSENLNQALSILRMFPASGAVTQRKPSRFNLDVKREIEKLGFRVSTEIGSCGFYIDLGVEHPNIQNAYMLGIECDGAIFHSSDYARDRDKARQVLLESRGWKIHRIWSQDWSKNRESEILKIKNLLDSILSAKVG